MTLCCLDLFNLCNKPTLTMCNLLHRICDCKQHRFFSVNNSIRVRNLCWQNHGSACLCREALFPTHKRQPPANHTEHFIFRNMHVPGRLFAVPCGIPHHCKPRPCAHSPSFIKNGKPYSTIVPSSPRRLYGCYHAPIALFVTNVWI